MPFDEIILEDSYWETTTIEVIPRGETVQVLLERLHKYQGLKLVLAVNLDMSQAVELGKRLTSFVNDHWSAY